MDIHRSGQIPFVKIEMKGCTVTITGRAVKPIKTTDETMFFSCTGKGINQVYVFDKQKQKLTSSPPLQPLFFENERYEIMVVCKGKRKLQIKHDSPAVEQAFQFINLEHESLLVGAVQFQNEVGFSTFEFYDGNEKYLSFTLEVFPSKMSYKNDYVNLVEQVNKSVHDIAYDIIGKTYVEAGTVWSREGNWMDFFHVLSRYFKPLMMQVNQIQMQPVRSVHSKYDVVRGDQVKKQDNRSIAYIRTHPNYLESSSRGVKITRKQRVVPKKALSVTHIESINNIENQTIKWMLKQISKKIEQLITLILERQQEINKMVSYRAMINQLTSMQDQIRHNLATRFWKSIQNQRFDNIPHTVRIAPRYRDVCRYYSLLTRGLALHGEFYKLSLKNIAQLYEYWVYMRFREILLAYFNLVTHDAINVTTSGLYVNMNSSYHEFVSYKGEKITLSYQYEFTNTHTVAQRPDLLLEIARKDGTHDVYVFDAKYRVRQKDNKLIAKEEDINTMHRYRDSLVNDSGNRIVKKAIVLFPGDTASYEQHHFYKSIYKVGIGALPFLPNDEAVVEKFIKSILDA
ncbi:DUF2357 domain-containing protein [Priestia megaterium]|nr:DUF2357 domain-containing protein [Priestia megaterium]